MLMKRDEDGELRPPRWELEESSYDDAATMLVDGTITRARAIKLAGAALLSASGLMMLFQSPAEAGRRRKKRRRRRRRPRSRRPRRARVTPTPPTLPSQQQDDEGNPVVNEIVLSVTNPSDRPLTISNVKLLGAEGAVVDPTVPVTIAAGDTANIPITVTYDPDSPLVDAGELRLYDGSGVPVQVTNGNTSGNVDLTFAPTV